MEESSEKVFFEWRGPSGSNAEDGRVRITEAGSVSSLEISPVHLQVIVPAGTEGSVYIIPDDRTRECGPARLKISMASPRPAAMCWPKVTCSHLLLTSWPMLPCCCSAQELQGPRLPRGAGGRADGGGHGVPGVQGGGDPLPRTQVVQGRRGDPVRRHPRPHPQPRQAGVRVPLRRRQLHGHRHLHLRAGRVSDSA